MRYMTVMEMLEMHCIFFLEGLQEMGVSTALPLAAPLPHHHSLLQLRVDGQHLRVTHEGEGHDGDGVRCLQNVQMNAGNPLPVPPGGPHHGTKPTWELRVKKLGVQAPTSAGSGAAGPSQCSPPRVTLVPLLMFPPCSGSGQGIWNFL